MKKIIVLIFSMLLVSPAFAQAIYGDTNVCMTQYDEWGPYQDVTYFGGGDGIAFLRLPLGGEALELILFL